MFAKKQLPIVLAGLLAVTSISAVRGESQMTSNPYGGALQTLVSQFEASLEGEANPQQTAKMQQELNEQIQALLEEYDIDPETTGIAFETLDGSLSYMLNADQEFTAASLYKVPLAMLYYDQMREGKIKRSDLLSYTADMYEEGSVIAANYPAGSEIPLNELLDTVIIYSDNTAGHILFENLGGWEKFQQAMQKYASSPKTMIEEGNMENMISCRYMNDCMKQLAGHTGQYDDLIQNMLLSQPENYLNRSLENNIPQKYGALDAQVNASGLNLTSPKPYVLTVMSHDLAAEMLVGDLSALIEEYLRTGKVPQRSGEELMDAAASQSSPQQEETDWIIEEAPGEVYLEEAEADPWYPDEEY